nr:hypothetical protein [Tanacetum cinerariifolium]
MQKNLDLIAKYFKKIYKPTNNNLRTSSNSRNKNVDTTSRFKNDNQSRQFGNQRTVNVAGARENVGSLVVQQSGIQCFNIKGHVPLFVPVEANGIVLEHALAFKPSIACDGIVFELDGIGGGGIVLEPDSGGIVFEVDGNGVGGYGIVFKEYGVEGVEVGCGMLLDGAS